MMRDRRHQPFGFEVADDLTHHGAAHPELVTEIALGEAAARLEMMLLDRGPQPVERNLPLCPGNFLDTKAADWIHRGAFHVIEITS